MQRALCEKLGLLDDDIEIVEIREAIWGVGESECEQIRDFFVEHSPTTLGTVFYSLAGEDYVDEVVAMAEHIVGTHYGREYAQPEAEWEILKAQVAELKAKLNGETP
jgi:hypothetical protein